MPKTKKNDNKRSRFDTANTAGDLETAVQLARAVVTRHIWSGELQDDANGLAELLTGDDRHPVAVGLNSETWHYHCRQLFAALAMGIAIGQLVSPDVFAKGGAR